MNWLEQQNQTIRAWGRENKRKLKLRVQSMFVSEDRLENSITVHTGTKEGAIYKVGFGLLRHGIFVEKGVGRGWPISRAGSGAGGRVPKPWFNPVVEPAVQELADELAKTQADVQADIITDRILIR